MHSVTCHASHFYEQCTTAVCTCLQHVRSATPQLSGRSTAQLPCCLAIHYRWPEVARIQIGQMAFHTLHSATRQTRCLLTEAWHGRPRTPKLRTQASSSHIAAQLQTTVTLPAQSGQLQSYTTCGYQQPTFAQSHRLQMPTS